MIIKTTVGIIIISILACSCGDNNSDKLTPPTSKASTPQPKTAPLHFMNFMTNNYGESRTKWRKAVEKAQQDGLIHIGMTLSDLIDLLWQPNE
jgi:hypothetical protein